MCKKGSKINSIILGTCPRCQEESMYVDPNPFNLVKAIKMHDQCSKCGLRYMIEPAFFYGAMYVSYAVGIAFAVAAFIISYLFFGTSLVTSFIAIVITLIVFMSFIMRVSRSIWINIFVSYDKENKKKA